jgi:hypothetical protein
MTPLALLALLPVSASSFGIPSRTLAPSQQRVAVSAASSDGSDSGSESSQQPSLTSQQDGTDVWKWDEWANENGVVAPKLSVREPLVEERGKGGVTALESVQALEVIARIPRALIVATCDMSPKAVEAAAEAKEFSWATDLTAATLAALHPTTTATTDDDDDDETTKNYAMAKQSWIANILVGGGGWATDSADLGPPEAEWGPSCVTGSLMATGSDNDHNIYAKFRFPCHPVVHRAAIGLAMLTGVDEDVARDALYCRGRAFRAMRDALVPLVLELTPMTSERKGSLRERRSWNVADVLSGVLARATTLQLDLEQDQDQAQAHSYCVVPLHERLAHCCDDARGENAKLVASSDNTQVLLVATRDIAVGEAITRDYATAPQLPEDTTEGALRLLLQFGLPPSAWGTTTN